MLTLYSTNSSFKKKVTVVAIWLIAFGLSIIYFKFAIDTHISFFAKLIPLILGLFMITGILLRCKIARGFTLVTLYFIAFFPLVSILMFSVLIPDIKAGGMLFYEVGDISLFSDIEILLTNLFWAFLVIIPVYFLSNEKAMDIFFIDTEISEHVFYILISLLLIAAYVYFSTIPFLESIAKPLALPST